MGGGSELEGEPARAKAYVKMLADGHTMNRTIAGAKTRTVIARPTFVPRLPLGILFG